MTYNSAFTHYSPYGVGPSTPLKQAIMGRVNGSIDYSGSEPVIRASFHGLCEAVESAFVLVEKATIPKARDVVRIGNTRSFSFEGEPWSGVKVNVGASSKAARSMAIKWLSIAAHIEAEENAKEKADAEAAKVAEAAAKNARTKRLNDIADLYFGKDFDDLGDNKASAVKEIYRLEEKLADEAKDAA